MALVETESLVLKSYNLAEADKIVVLFSRDHGMIRGVAKGAKRLRSKFGSALEPFSLVRATYFQKEVVELVSLQKVELTRSFFAAASDPDFLNKFSYLADLLITISPPHDPNETLFRMVKACLETADSDLHSLPAVSLYFELWLLRLAGYSPDWSTCDVCRRAFEDIEEADLTANFHLLCSGCRRSPGASKITAIQRRFFASARRVSPGDFVGFTAGHAGESSALSAVLRRIISQAIGRDITGGTFAVPHNSM